MSNDYKHIKVIRLNVPSEHRPSYLTCDCCSEKSTCSSAKVYNEKPINLAQVNLDKMVSEVSSFIKQDE